MTLVQENKAPESVQESLQQVQALLGQQPFAEPQNRSAARQGLSELQTLLDTLHPADVAYILEALPREQRLIVWELVRAERDGEILLEVSDAVRDDVTLEVVLRYLRRLGELPDQTDKLFVVDQQDHLKGVLSLKRLLTLDPGATVSSVMVDDVVLETKRAKRPRRSSAMTW